MTRVVLATYSSLQCQGSDGPLTRTHTATNRSGARAAIDQRVAARPLGTRLSRRRVTQPGAPQAPAYGKGWQPEGTDGNGHEGLPTGGHLTTPRAGVSDDFTEIWPTPERSFWAATRLPTTGADAPSWPLLASRRAGVRCDCSVRPERHFRHASTAAVPSIMGRTFGDSSGGVSATRAVVISGASWAVADVADG